MAGSLHLWFHKYPMQDTGLKYDPRAFPRNGRMFTFSNQLKDNIFWTIAFGVIILSLLEALFLWSMAKGFAGTITFDSTLTS